MRPKSKGLSVVEKVRLVGGPVMVEKQAGLAGRDGASRPAEGTVMGGDG